MILMRHMSATSTRTRGALAALTSRTILLPRVVRRSSSLAMGERLRVAVVGGGCAGLSSALHLAPLVEEGYLASPIDIYDAASPSKAGRDIGVGVWSTGLAPFEKSERSSHQLVYKEMTTHGAWVGDAGYRTPDGAWLIKSHLPTTPEECAAQNMPALLFLREKDMLLSLQKAVHWEENRGTVRVHRDGQKTKVTSIDEEASEPFSARLRLATDTFTEQDYHLIVAADGTHSMLRQRYGGYNLATQRLIGTAGLPSQNDLRVEASPWDDDLHLEATRLQDRNYTVFRGNAPLTDRAMGEDGVSFQTWGTGKSMRFATVPLHYPGPVGTREERQVWFATINDDVVTGEADPNKRKELLIDVFSSWHHPIAMTMEATPAEEILMERAVAHRHCIGPAVAMNKVIQRIRGMRPPNSGEGPCMVFVGDAYMTIDPILAQGFTVAMEGAFATKNSVQNSCKVSDPNSKYAFDPYLLRKQLKNRHEDRMDRLTCLLRVSELVQALGQPQGRSLTGTLNTYFLRPLTRLTPNFVKRPTFNAVLKYSLGL